MVKNVSADNIFSIIELFANYTKFGHKVVNLRTKKSINVIRQSKFSYIVPLKNVLKLSSPLYFRSSDRLWPDLYVLLCFVIIFFQELLWFLKLRIPVFMLRAAAPNYPVAPACAALIRWEMGGNQPPS